MKTLLVFVALLSASNLVYSQACDIYNYGIYTYPVNYPGNGISVSSSTPYIYISLRQADPSASFNWSTLSSSGYSTFWPSGGNATIYMQQLGSARTVACYSANGCGNGPTTTFNCYNYSSSYRMTTYPNPANTTLSVTASQETSDQEGPDSSKNDQVVTTDDLTKLDVALFDKDGVAVAKGKFVDNTLQLNTQKLPSGTYYLHIDDDKNAIKLQIIIRH